MTDRFREGARLLALMLLSVSAIWSVAVAYQQRLVWLLVVGLFLLPLSRKRGVPQRAAVSLLLRIGHGVVALTILYGFLWTSSLVYGGPLVALGPLTALSAVMIGMAFIVGMGVWSPGSAALPTLLAAMLSAALVASAPLGKPLILCAVALFLYGAVTLRPLAHSAHRRREMMQQALFVLAVALLALSTAFLLPWAQPHVERMVLTGMSSQARTGFSMSGGLGDVARLSRSTKLVARVFTNRPQRLRLFVATSFDGRSWSHEPAAESLFEPVDFKPVAGEQSGDWIPGRWFGVRNQALSRNMISASVISDFDFNGRLLTPAALRLALAPRDSLQVDGGGVIRCERVHLYRTLNEIEDKAARGRLPDDADLTVPDALDARIVELAQSLKKASDTPDARVDATLRFLSAGYRYTLEVGEIQTDQPLAEFLFVKKAGYCEYFASAAAVLLRLQGVPARYVRGFAVSEWNRRGEHFIIRESNAHAWVDAWTPARGWFEIDPTPPDQYARVHAESVSAIGSAWETIVAEWVALLARIRHMDAKTRIRRLLWIVFAVVFLMSLAIMRRKWRSRSTGSPISAALASYRPETERLLARIDRAFRKSGWPRPRNRAPLEHLHLIPKDAMARDRNESIARVIAHVYAEVFGGRPIRRELLEELDRSI